MLLFIGLDARSGPLDIVIPVFVMAFGMGFGMSQRTNIIAAAVPESEIGIASSVLALARNIAGAFGIAIFSTVLNDATQSAAFNIAKNSVINVHTPQVMGVAIALMELKAEIVAYHTVFILAAAVLGVAAIIAYFTIDVREKKSGVEVFVEG